MAVIAASYESEPTPNAADVFGGDGWRVRLVAVRIRRLPAGLARAEVDLQRPDGPVVTGTHEGPASADGDLRVVADATLDALHRASGGAVRFALQGVKTVRAFDETVVLVQVAVVAGRAPVRLVGAAMGDADHARTAVLSVLNATNRILGQPAD
ncbi:hypothetical protein [Roseisolibacter sp. H3M3-2]|uniref:hypothetical protein n=1 Tax=Roseisolibacter sp. H3M3-2 TaxID=3031323 RepID=UPI0023DC1586|nr:hypothetical protein [Roseisolibacter sp. H3M3-2]MDF1505829.1 hypothetical protein [Roseisolibacter sp. H3M3-2]